MVCQDMASPSDIDRDIAALRAMIDGSDADLADYMTERPYLRTAADARDDLAGLIVGLEDVRAGRMVPHAQIVADGEERRRRHRVQAAE